MILFFKKITVFIFILSVSAYLIQIFAEKKMAAFRVDEDALWNDVYYGKLNSDLLILGSSRSTFQMAPMILDTSLHANSYNLGMLGSSLSLQIEVFNIYLKHNPPPKTVIISFDLFSYTKRDSLYRNVQFLPFLNDTLIRNEAKKYKNGFNFLDYYIPLYKYRNNWDRVQNAIWGYIKPSINDKNFHDTRYKGYWGNPDKWSPTYLNYLHEHYPNGWYLETDPAILKKLQLFFKKCQEENIQAIVVYTPEHISYQKVITNMNELLARTDSICKVNNVPFINFQNDPIAKDTSFYYDSKHYNITGSELMTSKLATALKQYIKQE